MRPRCPWHAIIFLLHRPLSMSTPARARPAIVTYTKDAVLRGHGKFTFAISSRGTPHSIGGGEHGQFKNWEICFSGFISHPSTRANLPMMNHIAFPPPTIPKVNLETLIDSAAPYCDYKLPQFYRTPVKAVKDHSDNRHVLHSVQLTIVFN
ncbi:uncharacterized protein CCOS01_10430 [Colletotrichum costaricense]|nr:uncharacterized protein CCOS01_10430 [Colletotrichum costaricense]KAK1520311.1 hypothetical protein CCOS01_10430 [Colletotrichum costaricense]